MKNNKYSISASAAFRLIDGEYFIVTPGDSMLHCLNETATFLFGLLEKKGLMTASELASGICGEYETDEKEALGDVEGFLSALVEKGILEEK